MLEIGDLLCLICLVIQLDNYEFNLIYSVICLARNLTGNQIYLIYLIS